MSGGQIIVVSAPSGAGKGTVINNLRKINPDVRLSVSVTSRPPRKGEVEGADYFFVSEDRFKGMIVGGEFVEYDLYQGNFYGTSKIKIEEIINSGGDMAFDITIKGAYAIRGQYPHAALVFLLPPSFGELERRLRFRGTESEEKILGRLAEARKEVANLARFDYFIVNDDAAEAAHRLNSILTAEKCRVRKNNIDEIMESMQR